MEQIEGDTRVFCVINTTEYNNDGKWGIITAGYDDLRNLGFNEVDVEMIDGINVGGMLNQFDFNGVIIVRVA